MEQVKEPHSLSLKVLRLTKPSLVEQHPLPGNLSGAIDVRASLSHSGAEDTNFILSPLLSLPSGFGSAYVGETFGCTLCVNNELFDTADHTVTSVKIRADMQTPSQNIPLEFTSSDEDAVISGVKPGETLQKIVSFALREEGLHQLAVTISYSENIISQEEQSVSGGRVRSFRKLFQFPAVPCLTVRTKASSLPPAKNADGSGRFERFALEAQLENLADGLITLEDVIFEPKPPFRSTSLNWDMPDQNVEHLRPPTLAPREVVQVAFLIEEDAAFTKQAIKKEVTKDGRFILGILTIRWRSAFGEPGQLSTGLLTSRRK